MSDGKLGAIPIGRDSALVAVAILGLALGATSLAAGNGKLADVAWSGATILVLVALLAQIATSLRHGDFGLDVLAALSMSMAVLFGEALAGNIVALMYAGGQLLDSFAEGKARREMQALLGRVARTAMLYVDSHLVETPIEAIVPGARLLIRQGEVVPVDGTLVGGTAVLDNSALTGESLPQTLEAGGAVMSGATATGAAFDLIATRTAAESTYAGIVRLVEEAHETKAPMARLADRYAVGFLLATLVIAGLAWWLSGEPVRALAVLVVATPCPLILAVPVAIISGMSRLSRAGVLIKSGGVVETMARIKTIVLDKTGTLTHGSATLAGIRAAPGFAPEEVLRLAASLDQASTHVLAAALIEAAHRQGLALTPPAGVREKPGTGIEGVVGDRRVALGRDSYIAEHTAEDRKDLHAGLPPETVSVAVAIGGRFAGLLLLEDQVRQETVAVLAQLRASGMRLVLASGDHPAIARAVGQKLGLDVVEGDLGPAEKVGLLERARRHGPVMMVGDGVNDAPALAAADVGLAMGARGSAASSEAANAVVLVDSLAPVAEALHISRRTRNIALQSVWAGIGLSLTGMGFAAAGYLPPVYGALFQEAIDVAVILNALRALR
ncbi:heavy metal translocating P-type ATPase [Devosia nitrariae]|uniref:P-type Zn(2+) transporter n=1 Tax=Devosia nitrariae TaxID=2071872 RepID=A0ABQ5W959_9HYPH|nr:heavy metal translocating P-type ATPase [Devosia nitrariae]GLQ56645.1 hypothetical protein GCM10010862_39040 [Devosia nitrariae]